MKPFFLYTLAALPLLSYGISFNDLTQRVYDRSGEIIQSSGYVDALHYEKKSALASDPLVLEGSSRKIGADDSANSGMEYGVMALWALKNPKVREAQGIQYDLLAQRGQQEITFTKRRLQALLKREWLLAELEMERVTILTEKVESSKAAHAIGLKRFEGGRMSQMEVLRLETEYGHALQERAKAMLEADHIQHRLQEMSMIESEIHVDDLTFRFLRSPNEVLSKIDEAPSVLTLQMGIEALDAQIETIRRSKIESVSVGVGMTREPTQQSLDFRVNVPLAWSDKNENKIAALMRERSALLHRKEIAKEKLRLSVSALIEHLQERQGQFQSILENQKKYEKLFGMASKGLEGGVVTQFEYLATKNAFYDERLRSAELKRSYIEEMGEIEEKIGGVIE